ncbi:hypothetical protein [Bifidobacterium sp. SO4]|uniref:hypothetical protein n=1 Tax=Bifidobacterium sp. SO4 TaxID=2809030 RepID=UPI001BDC4386|nr:hypothetical protein [Bifidobacterium sp. SO4]MBT1171713.1 hypothetical protein [Bifidobacterium sp. SO4]
MLTQAQRAAAKAVENTKKRMLLTKTPRVRIAEESGVNRQTVAKYIEHSNDMTLSMFLAAQQLTGGDPVKELADALQATEKDPA